VLTFLLYEEVLGQTSYECKNKSVRRGAQLVPIGMPTEDSASKFYKNIVNEKVCFTISVILNKISIQSMNHNI